MLLTHRSEGRAKQPFPHLSDRHTNTSHPQSRVVTHMLTTACFISLPESIFRQAHVWSQKRLTSWRRQNGNRPQLGGTASWVECEDRRWRFRVGWSGSCRGVRRRGLAKGAAVNRSEWLTPGSPSQLHPVSSQVSPPAPSCLLPGLSTSSILPPLRFLHQGLIGTPTL